MKRLIIFALAVFTASAAFAQYPNAPNKMRLGAQTTGDGLLYRHAGAPNWTPTGINNAWQSIDTLTGDFYTYRNGTWFLEVKGDLQQVYPVVINKSGVNIKRGEVVSVDTSQIIQGDQIRIMRAIGDGGLSPKLIMGVAATDINNNATGYVAWFGYVREAVEANIAETGVTLNVGDILYLSATQPGRLTNVEPTPPALKSTIALLVRKPSVNNLTLLVRPSLNEDLSDLNDVDLNGVGNGQTIVWDSLNMKWIAGNVGTPIDTSLIATKSYVDSKVDSTRLTQDSILVYYTGGIEVGRDTLSLPAAGVTSITAGVGLTGGTITSTGTIAADTATVLVTKSFLTNQGYGTGTITGSGTNSEFSYFSSSTALTSSPRVKFETDGGLVLKNTTEPVSTSFLASQTFSDTTGWTTGAGWVITGGVAAATAATGALTYTGATITITSGRAYLVTVSQSGYSAGTATIALGNATSALPQYNVTAWAVVLRPTNSTGGFRFTTSTYTGNLDNVSIQEITPATQLMNFELSTNTTNRFPMTLPVVSSMGFGGGLQFTVGGNNTAHGVNAARDLIGGSSNVAQGVSAGENNTTGSSWIAQGTEAGRFNTIGSFWIAQGFQAGRNNTIGQYWIAQGAQAGLNNTRGSSWIAQGYGAGLANVSGSAWIAQGEGAAQGSLGSNFIAIGSQAGLRYSDGTLNANFTNSLYIGADTRAGGTTGQRNNETVIGYQAIGNGDFTTTIGNTSTIGYFLNGTGHLRLPSGTTAQRPGTPLVGMARNNTSNNNLDFYTGTAWENPLKSATTTGLGTAGRLFYADANGRAASALVGSGLTLSNDTLRVTSPNGATNLTFSGASSPVTLNSDTGTDVTFTAGDGISFSQTSNNLTISKGSPIYAVITVDSNRTSTFLAASVTPDTIDNPKISQVGGVFSVVGNGIQYTSGTARTFLITANADFKFSEANNIVKFQGWRSNGGTVIDIGTFGTVESVLGNEVMHTSFSAITSLSNNDLLRFGFTPGAHTGDDDLVLTNLSITITQL